MGILKNSWLRTSALTLLGMGMIYSAQSFTENKELKNEGKPLVVLANQTWYYQGGDPELPASYALTQAPGKTCDAEEEVICEISAPANSSDPTKPNMNATVPSTSQNVRQQIVSALNSFDHNDTVKAFRSE